MRYIIAGYVFVLTLLALYAVQLLWRRRRLTRAVDRVAGATGGVGAGTGAGAHPGAAGSPPGAAGAHPTAVAEAAP
jgi:hypothetical protein